jgi:threonylcarbamoyladenosine tRNA methylthiotransferase CDKAL1
MADDIEDLARDGSFEPLQRLERQELQPKAKLRKKKEGTNDSNDSTGAIGPVGDNIPVSGQSIYIKTWGCAHNNSDGEYMAGALANYGYRITETPEDANMWILNSCTGALQTILLLMTSKWYFEWFILLRDPKTTKASSRQFSV